MFPQYDLATDEIKYNILMKYILYRNHPHSIIPN